MRRKESQSTFSVETHNEKVKRLIRKFNSRLLAINSERMEIIEREHEGEKLCFADKARCSDLYLQAADLSRTIEQLNSLILSETTEMDKNSAFPVTHYCVGGVPRGDGKSFWVVQHPCGTRRRSWSIKKRDECIAAFREADSAIRGLVCSVVSEQTAFELALDSLSRSGKWVGFSMSEDQR